MTPADPPIYHITHADNLASIIGGGGLWSDAQRARRGITNTNIGHRHIKARRLQRDVPAAARGKLGDYVPFNFCPRSVMLFAVHKGHGDYAGGQEAIVHLVSSVAAAVKLGRACAFTDRHAELAHALYFDDMSRLGEVPWPAMTQRYWQDVREERQAEFLVHEFFPWTAISTVGVRTPTVEAHVQAVIAGAAHQPTVTVKPEWYY